MNWFHNLKISFKFVSCFVTILVVLIVGSMMGIMNANKVNQNLIRIYEEDLKTIRDLGEISTSINRINTSVGSYLLVANADIHKKEKEVIVSKQQAIDAALNRLSDRNFMEEERKELDLFIQLWSGYPQIINKVIGLKDQKQDVFAGSAYQWEILSKADGIDRTFQGLIEITQTKADASYTASLNMYNQIKMFSIAIMVISVIISCLLGYVMTYSILTPVRRLQQGIQKLAAGDLSQSMEIKRRDELGELAAGFETMRQSVGYIISQTKTLVGTLVDVSHDIRGAAQLTGESSQHIFRGLKEAAEASGQQARKIGEDAMVIKEMSAGLKQMAVTIDDVSSLSGDMESASKQGQDVVKDALDKMATIQQNSGQTTTIVGQLGAHSKEIDSIIMTIKSIAEETNLLALNASIEAARAGEAGRGFAVVASEVRNLSESCKNAAEHVKVVVQRIQQTTSELLVSNRAWMVEMNKGQGKVTDVSSAFQRIYDWIQHMNDKIQDMTAVIEEMAAGSEQIDTSIRRIEDYSGNVAGMNQEYSEKSGDQVHMMGKVNMSVEELLKLSDDLQRLVNRFVTV